MPPRPSCPPLVLSFCHADPTGAGGLQADLMTLASLGAHPVSVLTAVTVQDTGGLSAALAIDAEWIEDQARALFEDVPVAAIKVGTLLTVEAVAVVAEILADYPELPVVLQPLIQIAGADEADNEALRDAWRELLCPQASVLVVDVHEAEQLAGEDEAEHPPAAGDGGQGNARRWAECLIDAGCESVLLTGLADATGRPVIALYGAQGLLETIPWEVSPAGFHGAGDTLAAAVAAGLAGGDTIDAAVRAAREFTARTLQAGFTPGMGRALPDRFFWAREGNSDDAA